MSDQYDRTIEGTAQIAAAIAGGRASAGKSMSEHVAREIAKESLMVFRAVQDVIAGREPGKPTT